MITLTSAPAIRRLGQFGITDSIANSIVAAAEPATRRIIAEERTKFAEALMEGVAAGAAAVVTYVGTRYFVPDDKKTAKGVGYGLSALLMGGGAIWALTSLRSESAPSQPAGNTPAIVKSTAQQAAEDIVTKAEPKIRAIVEDERSRLVAAALEALPFAAAGTITAIGTWLLVSEKKPWAKALGYSVATGVTALGAWLGLSKEAA